MNDILASARAIDMVVGALMRILVSPLSGSEDETSVDGIIPLRCFSKKK